MPEDSAAQGPEAPSRATRHRQRRTRRVLTVVAGVAVLSLAGAALAVVTDDERPTAATGPVATTVTLPVTTRAPATTTTASTTTSTRRPTTTRAPATRPPAPAGFPGEHNTGVPPGTRLVASGGIIVTKDGAVIDRRDVNGCIVVKADRVTIRRTRVRCRGEYPILLASGHRDLLVEDVEIDGLDHPASVAIAHENYTLRRADVHDVGDGPRVGDDTVVEDSFIHDLTRCGDDCHNDGIQSTGGTDIVIRHNNIQNPRHQTSCILLGEEFEPLNGALIEGNLLNGGNYTIYAGGGTTRPNITIRNNHFGRDHVYGVLRASEQAAVEWAGNVWHDTGAPVQP